MASIAIMISGAIINVTAFKNHYPLIILKDKE